jgi:hypothetical protein
MIYIALVEISFHHDAQAVKQTLAVKPRYNGCALNIRRQPAAQLPEDEFNALVYGQGLTLEIDHFKWFHLVKTFYYHKIAG